MGTCKMRKNKDSEEHVKRACDTNGTTHHAWEGGQWGQSVKLTCLRLTWGQKTHQLNIQEKTRIGQQR